MFLVCRLHFPSLEIFSWSKLHENIPSFEHMTSRFDFCNQNVGFFTAQSSYYCIHLKDKSTIMSYFTKVFFMAVACSNSEAANWQKRIARQTQVKKETQIRNLVRITHNEQKKESCRQSPHPYTAPNSMCRASFHLMTQLLLLLLRHTNQSQSWHPRFATSI